MFGLRRYAKVTVEVALCRSGIAAASRRRRNGDALVLAYHNIVPDGRSVDGDRSLHLAQRAFARQLDILRRTHDVVPLLALFESSAPGRRPRAVITFDDAYQGAVTAGVEELDRRRLPATFFITPAFVGGGSFWWDALSAPGATGPAPALREAALRDFGGDDAAVRAHARACGTRPRELPDHLVCATEAQLSAAASTGITYGSHTWSHAYLPALDAGALRHELEAPRVWLKERFRNVVDWLTYPYGGASPAVAEAVRDAGYAGAFCVEGGWLTRSWPGSRFLLPRENVPAGLSRYGFELRASGLFTG